MNTHHRGSMNDLTCKVLSSMAGSPATSRRALRPGKGRIRKDPHVAPARSTQGLLVLSQVIIMIII